MTTTRFLSFAPLRDTFQNRNFVLIYFILLKELQHFLIFSGLFTQGHFLFYGQTIEDFSVPLLLKYFVTKVKIWSALLLFAGAFAIGALQTAGEYDAGEDKWVETSETSLWGARRTHSRAPYWAVSAQWNSENSQTHAWFIVFLWVTSARLLSFYSDSPVCLIFFSLSVSLSSASHFCLRMKMALCCLWEQRARGWLLVPVHLGWTSWRGQRCCYPSTLAACWHLSTCAFARTREYWVFLSYLEAGKHTCTLPIKSFGLVSFLMFLSICILCLPRLH